MAKGLRAENAEVARGLKRTTDSSLHRFAFVPERWDPPRVDHHVREKRDMSDTQKHETLTDDELWAEVLRDSSEAFEQIVTRYQNLIA